MIYLIACTILCMVSCMGNGNETWAADADNVPAGSQIPARVERGSLPTVVESGQAKVTKQLEPTLPMRVTIVLAPPRQDELQALIGQMLDPKSPRFHQFLTFDQWKSNYAPTDADVQAVADWASAAGLHEIHRFASNHAMVVQGTVSAVEQAFAVTLNQYQLGAHLFFANDRSPTVPTEIAGKIQDVVGLSSYEQVRSPQVKYPLPDIPTPRVSNGPFATVSETHADARPPAAGQKREQPRLPDSIRRQLSGAHGGIEPPDLWSDQAYNYANLARFSHCCNPTNAAGGTPPETSIAIIGTNKPQDSDFITFASTYNLAINVTEVQIDGPSCCDDEMTLDIEWATAMSNSFGAYTDTAHLYVYEGGDPTAAEALNAFEDALSDNKVRVLSVSFGDAESLYGQNGILGCCNPHISDFKYVTNSMTALGWTLVAAAGDDGAYADCANLSAASDPYVIAAGGTTLTLNPANAGVTFGSEKAWSGNGCQAKNGNGGGGGGGCSGVFSAPPWNALGLCPNQARGIPDLSLNAGNTQAVFYGGQWVGRSGTSLVAPELAGFFAQMNSYLAFIGQAGPICGPNHNGACTPLGQPGYALYAANNSTIHNAAQNPWYDIKDGSCNGGGPASGYCTLPGYDLATGWGSANMLQLAWAISHFYNTPANPPTITIQGPPVNTWYSTDQQVSFTIGGATMGVAGYTAKWDVDPGDPSSHPTPGTGDPFWDGPQVAFGTSGSLDLAAAGQGCHTAFVRAWDNNGTGAAATYGPICLGSPPQCSINFVCEAPVYAPPQYAVQCTNTVAFFNGTIAGVAPPVYVSAGEDSGAASTVPGSGYVQACFPGTNNCTSFATYVPQSGWCAPPPPPPPPNFCKECEATGGICTSEPGGRKICVHE